MSRPVRQWRSSSKANYNEFLVRNSSSKITYDLFVKIIYAWNNALAKHILDTGVRIRIPYGLGLLTVTKYKPKKYRISKKGEQIVNLPIDWLETKKQGKYVYHMNYETDGFNYYWYWNCYSSHIKTPSIWKLEMARVHSRSLASILKKPNSTNKFLYKEWVNKK